MPEQMNNSMSVDEIMERIRERVRLRKQDGNDKAMADPAASIPISRKGTAALSLYDLSKMRQNAAANNMLCNQVGTINPRRPGLHNNLIQLAKKAIRRALTWYTRPLQEFHSSVTRTLNETAHAVENLQGNVIATSQRVNSLADSQTNLVQRVNSLADSQTNLVQRVDSLADSQTNLVQRVDSLADSQTNLAQRLNDSEASQKASFGTVSQHLRRLEEALTGGRVDARLRLIELRVRRLTYMLEQKGQLASVSIGPEPPPMFPSAIPSDSEFDYFLFEERFRGSEEEIKNRHKAYLDYFRGRENVVDLGCGRGEFLELMRENEVPARGVESNTDMFLLCREKGLDVVQQDLFSYLESVPDGSLGGIFCSQVIEHVPAGLQLRLLALAKRTLKPGSPLVVETINPECLFALARNFFLDPTHVRPVHPEMLRFVLESLHFEKIEVKFSALVNSGRQIPKLTLPDPSPNLESFNQGLQHLNTFVFGYQDYAVVGYR
jgi:SAM-dependent methyltransferase/uncharacterized protein YoxC